MCCFRRRQRTGGRAIRPLGLTLRRPPSSEAPIGDGSEDGCLEHFQRPSVGVEVYWGADRKGRLERPVADWQVEAAGDPERGE